MKANDAVKALRCSKRCGGSFCPDEKCIYYSEKFNACAANNDGFLLAVADLVEHQQEELKAARNIEEYRRYHNEP